MGHAFTERGGFLAGLLAERGELPTGLIAECDEFAACFGRRPLAAQNQARQADRDANDRADNCICFHRHGLVSVYAAFRSTIRQMVMGKR